MERSLSVITAAAARQEATTVCMTLCLSVGGQTNAQARGNGWLVVGATLRAPGAVEELLVARVKPANQPLRIAIPARNRRLRLSHYHSATLILLLLNSQRIRHTMTLHRSRAMADSIPRSVGAMVLCIVLIYLNLPTVGSHPLCVTSSSFRALVGYSMLFLLAF
jgi:hypothetical protein